MSTTDYRYTKNEKPQSKKITLADIDEKYLPQWFVEMRKDEHLIIDGNTVAKALEAALNNKQAEKNVKLEAKRHEEEQRQMAEYQKKQRQESELRAEARRQVPESQYRRFVSGELQYSTCYGCRTYLDPYLLCTNSWCQYHEKIDIEQLMRKLKAVANEYEALKQEISTGQIIKTIIGLSAYNRLVEFAIPDETYPEVMNRLLDIATATVKTK
jgi:hypothetical protein